MSRSQTQTTVDERPTGRPVLNGELPAHGVEMGDLTNVLETDLQSDTVLIDPCIYWCNPTPYVE